MKEARTLTLIETLQIIDTLQEQVAEINSRLDIINNGKQIERPIDLGEASEFLGLAKPTLYQLTSKRIIPHYRVGKHLKFYKSELNDFIKSRKKYLVKA